MPLASLALFTHHGRAMIIQLKICISQSNIKQLKLVSINAQSLLIILKHGFKSEFVFIQNLFKQHKIL